MIGWAVEYGVSMLVLFDLPALFGLFLLKGAIVGKPIPTSVFLSGYLAALSPSRQTIALTVLVASVGYVCGQLLIYWLASARGTEAIRSIPRVTISDARLSKTNRLFRRYGGPGIFVTNLTPYLGSFLMIPAGIASYPVERAAFYAFTSTLLNYALVVWFVLESVRLVSAG